LEAHELANIHNFHYRLMRLNVPQSEIRRIFDAIVKPVFSKPNEEYIKMVTGGLKNEKLARATHFGGVLQDFFFHLENAESDKAPAPVFRGSGLQGPD
jgi:hypothetical protein